MCIGLPMQILETLPGQARCQGQGEEQWIDMMLLGDQPVGTWILTFLNTGREVISPKQAALISDALTALDMAMQGDNQFDHLFADLVDREPELPDFLKRGT